MTSNQDGKQKEPIPMTGIKVMDDLSLDAAKVLYLAYKRLLVPFIPSVLNPKWIELCMSSRDNPPGNYVPQWMYWKSDVEEFKLKHKELLEELQKQKASTLDGSQKQDPPESGYFVEIGKKGGKKTKINRPILDAVVNYMKENPKTHDMTNGQIAKKFCRKYTENCPMLIDADQSEWDIYSDGEYVFSMGYGSHSSEKVSIKMNTFINNYVSRAKASFLTISDKSPL